jgi:hypothetical protein
MVDQVLPAELGFPKTLIYGFKGKVRNPVTG